MISLRYIEKIMMMKELLPIRILHQPNTHQNPDQPTTQTSPHPQNDPYPLHPSPQKKESISNHLSPNESFNAWLFWQM